MSATVRRSLARRGQSVIVRRLPSTDVTCQGFISRAEAIDIPGQQPQVRRELRIGNDEIAAAGWPGPPRKGDRVTTNGVTSMVEACDTRRKGSAIAMHIIKIVGAA